MGIGGHNIREVNLRGGEGRKGSGIVVRPIAPGRPDGGIGGVSSGHPHIAVLFHVEQIIFHRQRGLFAADRGGELEGGIIAGDLVAVFIRILDHLGVSVCALVEVPSRGNERGRGSNRDRAWFFPDIRDADLISIDR